MPSRCGRGCPQPSIGVLGGSYSDEYQFYPPDRSTAQNWVEILARTRGANFGRSSTHSRGEPRNQGFEFNWAQSDATSTDLIKSRQHTGSAKQFAEPLERGLLSPSLALAFNAAVDQYNREIRAMALGKARVAILDLALVSRLALRPDRDHVRLCGRTLDQAHPRNHPDHLFLGDSRHVGTLAQAAMANLVIHMLNVRFDTRIKPLGVAETLDLARPRHRS